MFGMSAGLQMPSVAATGRYYSDTLFEIRLAKAASLDTFCSGPRN
jgi:hypothetical protein